MPLTKAALQAGLFRNMKNRKVTVNSPALHPLVKFLPCVASSQGYQYGQSSFEGYNIIEGRQSNSSFIPRNQLGFPSSRDRQASMNYRGRGQFRSHLMDPVWQGRQAQRHPNARTTSRYPPERYIPPSFDHIVVSDGSFPRDTYGVCHSEVQVLPALRREVDNPPTQ